MHKFVSLCDFEISRPNIVSHIFAVVIFLSSWILIGLPLWKGWSVLQLCSILGTPSKEKATGSGEIVQNTHGNSSSAPGGGQPWETMHQTDTLLHPSFTRLSCKKLKEKGGDVCVSDGMKGARRWFMDLRDKGHSRPYILVQVEPLANIILNESIHVSHLQMCFGHSQGYTSVKYCYYCNITTVAVIIIQHKFSSVTQSCPTLCNPMDCSMPGFLVHYQLLEPAQSHVCRVGDAIQPSHLLSSPSPAFNLSQHQGLF